jgi:predicted phosphohydrolase
VLYHNNQTFLCDNRQKEIVLQSLNEILENSHEMPALGVSIDKEIQSAKSCGVWVEFLYNNAYDLGEYVLAGTRYWDYDEETEDNDKIFNREILRAKLSLDEAKRIAPEKPIIFTTHYPPDHKIIKALSEYNISIWIYGHIHTKYEENIVDIAGIKTFLTSCDYLDFKLLKID